MRNATGAVMQVYGLTLGDLAAQPVRRNRNASDIDWQIYTGGFRDTGCDVSPRCLTCPLARCKHDDPEDYREGVQLALDMAALAGERRVTRRTLNRARQRLAVAP